MRDDIDADMAGRNWTSLQPPPENFKTLPIFGGRCWRLGALCNGRALRRSWICSAFRRGRKLRQTRKVAI